MRSVTSRCCSAFELCSTAEHARLSCSRVCGHPPRMRASRLEHHANAHKSGTGQVDIHHLRARNHDLSFCSHPQVRLEHRQDAFRKYTTLNACSISSPSPLCYLPLRRESSGVFASCFECGFEASIADSEISPNSKRMTPTSRGTK
jgi:hypothetical protein